MQFDFDPPTQSDLQLLFDWLNRAHVMEWWGAPISLNAVREKYLPRLSTSFSVRPYLVCLNRAPVGFIQSSVVLAEQASGWRLEERDPGALGIDQFIADAENLGKGIGTEIVSQFVECLFRDPAVTKIQTDPAPTNLRAIRCYEKAEFRKIGIIDTPDGSAQLMVVDRNRDAAAIWPALISASYAR